MSRNDSGSSNFEVAVKNISSIFSSQNDFPILNVPHYQRGFSWKKDEINELLDDIDNASKQGRDEYFIGPVTILLNQNTNNDEIIDGQQRLTTVALIIRYLSSELLLSNHVNFRANAQLQLVVKNNKAAIKHLRRDDGATFARILNVNGHETSKSILMKEADVTIAQYFKGFNDNEKSIYLSYLCNKVICIVVVCLDDDISYQIFETLNARGKGLSPLDLIRNKLFSVIATDNLENSIKIWDELYLVLKHALNGGQADTHIQTLFSIVLGIRTGKWLEPKSLFPAMRDYLYQDKQAPRTSHELINFICSDISKRSYIRLSKPSQTGNSEELEYCLKDFKNYKILSPLIYAIFYKEYAPDVAAKAISMAGALVKRTQVLSNIPIMHYGQLFTGIAKRIYEQEKDEDSILKMIRDEIENHDSGDKGKRVLNDEQFVTQLSELATIKEDRARDILISVFNHKKETRAQRLSASSDLHIEHILPQKLHKKNWPNFDDESHKNYHQRLGNMMILSGKRNIDAARKPFVDKLNNSYLGNDFWKVAFLEEDTEEWTEAKIKDRQKLIAKEIAKVWTIGFE